MQFKRLLSNTMDTYGRAVNYVIKHWKSLDNFTQSTLDHKSTVRKKNESSTWSITAIDGAAFIFLHLLHFFHFSNSSLETYFEVVGNYVNGMKKVATGFLVLIAFLGSFIEREEKKSFSRIYFGSRTCIIILNFFIFFLGLICSLEKTQNWRCSRKTFKMMQSSSVWIDWNWFSNWWS